MEIKAVIFDWAGTTVDFGCFTPLNVFTEIFKRKGIEITLEEARLPMGMAKIDHVRALLQMDRIGELFKEQFGRDWEEEDVSELYKDFEPSLMETLHQYTEVLPGVLDTCNWLREKGLKIGSTTGYTTEMMEVVIEGARKQGYTPDAIVTADRVNDYGRPYPYMLFKNMEILGIYPPQAVVKVGDTLSDIREGVNAGAISVGIVVGSSVMGLTEEEFNALSPEEKETICQRTAAAYLDGGAHYAIQTMNELPSLIEKINSERKDA